MSTEVWNGKAEIDVFYAFCVWNFENDVNQSFYLLLSGEVRSALLPLKLEAQSYIAQSYKRYSLILVTVEWISIMV